MSYIRNGLTSVTAALIAVMVFTPLAIWQFYLFIIFRNPESMMVMEGGTHHLWLALGATLIACTAGFFVFSVFRRHDS
jgi:hypothetical protein